VEKLILSALLDDKATLLKPKPEINLVMTEGLSADDAMVANLVFDASPPEDDEKIDFGDLKVPDMTSDLIMTKQNVSKYNNPEDENKLHPLSAVKLTSKRVLDPHNEIERVLRDTADKLTNRESELKEFVKKFIDSPIQIATVFNRYADKIGDDMYANKVRIKKVRVMMTDLEEELGYDMDHF